GNLSIVPIGLVIVSVGVGLTFIVNRFMLGGVNKIFGTWGGMGLGATHININYFAAISGKLSVMIDICLTLTIDIVSTVSVITYNQTLASSTLNNGSASITSTFNFTSPSTTPNAGTASQNVTFTPTNTENYTTTNTNVSITVN